MKSIEHKILIPFLLIVLLPSLAVGITAMWSGYHAEKQQQLQTIEETVDSSVAYLNILSEQRDSGALSNTQAEYLAEQYLAQQEDLYVRKNNGVLFQDGERAQLDDGMTKQTFYNERGVFQSEVEGWNWTIYYPYHFSFFSELMVEIQKYTLLILIISGLMAIELTIILSHHLSKPLKKIAAFCNQILNDETPDKTLLRMKRRDEVGLLATSLENMVDSLHEKHKQLSEMKKRNETIIESTHLGMAVMNPDGTTAIQNESLKSLLTHFPALADKLAHQHTDGTKETLWVIEADGNSHYFSVHRNVLPIGEEVEQRLITIEDITKRKQIEQRMERIERLNALGKMAAGLAHEIRNPLAGVKTTIQLLLRRLSLEGENKQLTSNLLREIERVERIIKQLLNLARPVQAVAQDVSLKDVIESSVQLTKSMARKANIEVTLALEEGAIVTADVDHLRQVFLNLTINAFEAMPDGGVLHIHSYAEHDKIVVEVTDTGKGMDQQTIEQIFDPFFTTRAEGTGLGLAIVHQLIVQNYGEIDVASKPGAGTTFRLTFPRKDEQV
ncbi:ATP-binding protein [Bacillus tianshenii]|nr:ATP-binding protein [Bacillus tianshenii]